MNVRVRSILWGQQRGRDKTRGHGKVSDQLGYKWKLCGDSVDVTANKFSVHIRILISQPIHLHMQWWSNVWTHLLQNLQCIDFSDTSWRQIQQCLVGSLWSQLLVPPLFEPFCWWPFPSSFPSPPSPFSRSSWVGNRGSAGSIVIARSPFTAEEHAVIKKTMVHGIDTATGKIGDTTTRNSMTKDGSANHVDICAEVKGGVTPFFRLGRGVRTSSSGIVLCPSLVRNIRRQQNKSLLPRPNDQYDEFSFGQLLVWNKDVAIRGSHELQMTAAIWNRRDKQWCTPSAPLPTNAVIQLEKAIYPLRSGLQRPSRVEYCSNGARSK